MANANENIDKILLEQKAKGGNYATWQSERYPVVASHKNSRKDIELEEKVKNLLYNNPQMKEKIATMEKWQRQMKLSLK